MAKPKYSYAKFDEHCVAAYGRSLGISTKVAIEVANFIRGKSAERALKELNEVIAEKTAIPFKRFTDGVGHRRGKGIASGRYPFKAATAFKNLILSAQANAANQGMDESLNIVHLCAHKASRPFHQGRQRSRVMKKTHVELVLREAEVKKVEKKAKATTAKAKPVKNNEESKQ